MIKGSTLTRAPFPARIGVGANQPADSKERVKPIALWACFFSAVMLLLQIYAAATSQEKTVFAQAFTFLANDPEKIKVTPKFQLDGGLANVQAILYGEVGNSWMDSDMTLVNDVTGEKFVFDAGVEYYYGSDSDGPWTEGDKSKDVILPEVPGGTYYLTIQPTLAAGTASQNFSVTINRDVVLWSNFWFLFFLLWLFPAGLWYWSYRMEIARWSDENS